MRNFYQKISDHILIVFSTIIYFFINYYFIDKKNLLLISALFYILFILFFLYKKYKNFFINLLSNVKIEVKNIAWPSRNDVKQTTFIVVVVVFFASLILWLVDSLFIYVISKTM